MRVLLINSVAGFGSTGRICLDLYDAYTTAGHDAWIAFGRMQDPPASYNSYRIGSPLSFGEHVLETFLLDNHGLASRRATRRLVAFIRQYNPDIIHLHNIHGYYLNYPILFSYLIREFTGAVIWTLHDMWTMSGHAASIPVEEFGPDGDTNPRARLLAYPPSFTDRHDRNYFLKKSWFTQLENVIAVCPSHWLASVASISWWSAYPIEVIHNGIDLSSFSPIPMTAQPEKTVLAVASVWTKSKGLPDLIELAPRLPRGYSMTIIGKTPANVHFPDNIHLIKRTSSRDELAHAYSRADVLVNPTHNDVLSMVNIEAQACGTPVVVYDTDGTPETITRGTGIVVKSKTVDEMLHHVLSINKNDETIKACRAWAETFSRDKMGSAYVDLARRNAK